MPKLKHRVEVDYKPSFRSEKVVGMFDVPVEEKLSQQWDVDMPFEEEDWQIGFIVGPSGSGKTTLAKRIFGEDGYHRGYEWNGAHVVDDFPKGMDIADITKALSHVGFSSPPAWIKPYKVLSNGQQFRADIARTILDPDMPLVVYDEFTSVVDRTVAKIGCEAVQKYIRRSKKQFVAVSCHYDIIEWLRPDWVYRVDTNSFEWTRGRLRRPELKLEVRRVHHSAWRIFKGHHYLSEDINTAAHCYVGFLNEEPAAFVACLFHPGSKTGNLFRGHRAVVLPDYQGIGIGNRVGDIVAEHYITSTMRELGLGNNMKNRKNIDKPCRYRGTTSHPAFFFSYMKNPKWKLVRAPSQVAVPGSTSKMGGFSVGRLTASFEYVGSKQE